MKRKDWALGIAMALLLSIAPYPVKAESTDQVQFVVDSAQFVHNKGSLEVKGHYVNASNKPVENILETDIEIYVGEQCLINDTFVRNTKESIRLNIGGISKEYTLLLPDPDTDLTVQDITSNTEVSCIFGEEQPLTQGKKVYIDGNAVQYDVDPVVSHDRLLIPARATFEKIGAIVQWNQESQTAQIQTDSRIIDVTIGQDTMMVNQVPIQLDAPAEIVNGRTLLPLRAISEALGYRVYYGATNEMALIYTDPSMGMAEPMLEAGAEALTEQADIVVTPLPTEEATDASVTPVKTEQTTDPSVKTEEVADTVVAPVPAEEATNTVVQSESSAETLPEKTTEPLDETGTEQE